MKKTIQIVSSALMAGIPVVMMGFSTGPPQQRTGAAIDGAITCSACHQGTPVNGGPGRVLIRANAYTPGVKQIVEVEVSDPDQMRWGFQLTARLASNEATQAGTFTGDDTNIRIRCQNGTFDAPCNGTQEFASHRQPNTGLGTRNGRVFRVEWTPPATDMGDVVFYAAGNAANGNGNNQGDRIYNTSLRVTSDSCTLTGTPTIRANGVANGADFRATIGQNAMITIFGAGFAAQGQTRRAGSLDVVNGRLTRELACVAVEIGGTRVPVFYVQGDQINAIGPWTDNSGAMDVRVILNPGRSNEIRSAAASATVAEFSPAFFTFNTKSIAAINATRGGIVADPAVVAGGTPAKPGDVVTLYGTGFGWTNPVFGSGEFSSGAAPVREQATVTIGGTTLAAADVLYVGLSPDAPGFYQINVRIPAAAADGDIPVSIRIGGVSTQAGATIPVKR